MKKAFALATTLLLVSAPSVWAHPGHGFGGTVESAIHWVVSIDHAVTVMALMAVVGVALGVRAVRAVRQRASS